MAQLFAYIAHKQGVLDDSAAELAVAAAKIAAGEPVTAIVTGSGPDLDTACQAAAAIYPAVWKFDNAELAYPNAEIVRKLLVKVLPADGIVLIPHDTFGMDLGPGLSIKLEAPMQPTWSASTVPTAAPPFWCGRNTPEWPTRTSAATSPTAP
jgi:electron transfer flavoprotein alpha subunit